MAWGSAVGKGQDMDIILVINLKGGVGKTTSAVALSETLAHKGYHTLLIDADHQCMAGEMLLGEEKLMSCEVGRVTLHELLGHFLDPGFSPEGIGRFVQGAASDIDGGMLTLSCIPCSLRIDEFQRNMTKARRGFKSNDEFLKVWSHSHWKFRKWLKERFDFVIIDCPPSLAVQVRFMMSLCDSYIIPAVPDKVSIRGTRYLLEHLRRMNYRKPSLGVLWTMYDAKDKLHRNIVEPQDMLVEPNFDIPRPFRHVLPRSAHLAAISGHKPGVGNFKDKYSPSLAGVLRNFGDEVVGRCRDVKALN